MHRFFATLSSSGRAVVTCRPHVVPPTAACSRYVVPDLALDEALGVVRQRVGGDGPLDDVHDETMAALEHTDAVQAPFFADLIGQVLASGRSPGAVPEAMDKARMAVLDRAHEALPAELRRVLGQFAVELLRLGRYEVRLSSVRGTDDPQSQPRLTLDLMEQAVALGVLRTRELAREEVVRFSHPILVAYFGSLAMAASPTSYVGAGSAADLEASTLPEADQAIVWAAIRDGPDAWLTRLGQGARTESRAAVVAVRVCAAANVGPPQWLRRWVASEPMPATLQQHQLLAAASASRASWAVDVLLKLLDGSEDYGVRWAAAIHLGQRGENSKVTSWADDRVRAIAATSEGERGLQPQEGLL